MSQYVFGTVLPTFGDLNARADKLANDHYNRFASQPANQNEHIDMAVVAETADNQAESWYVMMRSLRQTMLNLLSAGLFHLVEQQLAAFGRDGGFIAKAPSDTKISDLVKWYQEHIHVDLRSLPSWALVDELRLVANAVKHAEGDATKKLRTRRPVLFSDPEYSFIYEEDGEIPDPAVSPVSSPL